MKKLAALSLIAILLFNIAGYSIVYWMASEKASKELSAKLDNDQYSGSQAVTIKIPVSLPYQPDRDYERVDGEFEYQGQFYKLVKQRVLGDTLYVVCVIDGKEKQLSDEMNRFTNQANDTSKQPVKIASNSPIQVYSNGHEIELMSASTGWTFDITYLNPSSSLTATFIEKNSPPPWAQ